MYHYHTPNIADQGWKAFPAAGGSNLDSLRRGKGYSVFVREATIPTTWELTGNPIQGNFSFALTPDTGLSNDGWNLIGNPYASAIQWTDGISGGWSSSGVGNYIWVRENSGSGSTWKTWGNGTGDEDFGGIIAPGQAFWVQTTSGSPTLTITENAKYSGQGTFYRTASSFTNSLTVALSNGTLTDKTYIKSSEYGSDSYFKTEDAVKQPNSYFNLSSRSEDGISLAINIVGEEFCEKTVPLRLNNATPGNYSLSFKGLDNFYHGLKASLRDTYSDTEHLITENFTYSFSVTTDTLTQGDRFVVVMNKPEVRTDLQVTGSAECENDAIVKIEGAQAGVLYQLFDGETVLSEKVGVSAGGDLIEFSVSKALVGYGSSPLTIKAGFAGCDAISMEEAVTVVIDTVGVPEISLTENDQLTTSVNDADSYEWFMDGVLITGESSNSIVPPGEGEYLVKVTRGTCAETSETFNYLTTGLEEAEGNKVTIFPNPFEDRITIVLNGSKAKEIKLRDMVGRLLYSVEVKDGEQEISMDLTSLSPGAFILNVGSGRYKIIKRK